MRHSTRILCVYCGLTVLLYVSSLILAQASTEVVLYQENFDSGQAPGWELEPGWQVSQDGDDWALTGEGHHWARPDFNAGGDFRLQFRLKLLRGRIHLVYRMNENRALFHRLRR